MGFAFCRFKENTGCSVTGSTEYMVHLEDKNILLNVPEMWKHYLEDHLVQPLRSEREVVMSADPMYANACLIGTFGTPREIPILYVEKTQGGYTHEVGRVVDAEFRDKLQTLVNSGKFFQTKGL
jgi:hypothetical protein